MAAIIAVVNEQVSLHAIERLVRILAPQCLIGGASQVKSAAAIQSGHLILYQDLNKPLQASAHGSLAALAEIAAAFE